jgi:glutaminyl-peptide cyclotransferase
MEFPRELFRVIRLIPVMLAAGFLMVACAPPAPAVLVKPFVSNLAPSPTPPVSGLGLPAAPNLTFRVVNTYPHDRAAYTEGLVVDGGAVYEGTGLNGQSTLRQVDLESGKVLQSAALGPQHFGEGVTTWNDQIIQLTWKSHLGFVYDRATFKLLKTFNYPTEGWGLTQDGASLITSDGTSTLHFMDPVTFQETKRITVTDQGRPVVNLNELEYVRGEILANVWQTDRIARIAPETGAVIGWIDLAGLLNPAERPPSVDAVLNGIAYDAGHDRLFVTGKLWPKLFEITLVPRP